MNREPSCARAGRGREPAGGQVREPFKPSKKTCPVYTHSSQSDVDLRPYNDKQKDKIRKEGHGGREGDSSSYQLDESKLADVKASSASLTRKSVKITVNEKKTVNASRY